MPSGHLILHQNQNQAAWAVKFHPALRGTKAFREMCVLLKDALHLSSSLQSRQRFMHWMRAEFWHNVVTPATKQKTRSQTFRKGSRGDWGKTWKYQRLLLRKSMNFSSGKRRSQLTMWEARASFGSCVTENNVVACPQLSRQPAVKVYLHQWPLEQQLRVSYPRESLLDSCKATQVQLLLNRDMR